MRSSSRDSRDEALALVPAGGARCTIRSEACTGSAGIEGSREMFCRGLCGGARGEPESRRVGGLVVPSCSSHVAAEVGLEGRCR